MTDKITVHPIKKIVLGAFSVSWAIAFLLSTSALTQAVHAAEQLSVSFTSLTLPW